MTVRIILHGGLGNQMFQLFYGELLSKMLGADALTIVTSRLASYAVGRAMELTPLFPAVEPDVGVTDGMAMLERARLPKLIRAVIGREVPLRLGAGRALVDGYFQCPDAYSRFGVSAVAAQCARWRRHLLQARQIVAPHLSHLTHVRLTDFVAAGLDPRVLAAPILAGMPTGGSIMTDDEETIGALIDDQSATDKLTLIPTRGLSSWAILQAMSAFREISTNGSSLACWAAALNGARFTSINPDHVRFARMSQANADA